VGNVEGLTLESTGGGTVVINMALTYVGDVQLEIIEPVAGEVDVYRSWLPEGFAVRHHHLCSRLDSVEELEQLRASYVARSYRIALDASYEGSPLFYVDTTQLLDHYQEYCWLGQASIDFMAGLPRN
jgi:hypothetical protein